MAFMATASRTMLGLATAFARLTGPQGIRVIRIGARVQIRIGFTRTLFAATGLNDGSKGG